MSTNPSQLVLPNEPYSKVLLKHISDSPDRLTFIDSKLGITANYTQFIQDVQATQIELRAKRYTAGCQCSPYVFLLNPCNYEFAIAALASLTMGLAIVPLAPAIMPEEALHLIKMCRSATMLVGSTTTQRGNEIVEYAATHSYHVDPVPICIKSHESVTITIDENWTIKDSSPGMIVFTSGTSGPPKAVVHSRRLFYVEYQPNTNGVCLLSGSPQWVGGSLRMILHTLKGWCINILPADPEIIWERLREGGITFMTCPPLLWKKLKDYFEDSLDSYPPVKREEYLRGMRSILSANTSGSSLPGWLGKFWRGIGRPITICYGATELGRISLMTTKDSNPDIKNCLGRPVSGIIVRLSDGDHGELEIKTPALFLEYLNDPTATGKAFTPDGFYKTGDCAHKEGEDYVFDGRVSSDFIKFRGYRVPIIELETRLMELAGVNEAYVIPVPDVKSGFRVGALLRLQQASGSESVDLPYIRSQLAKVAPTFMIPTALRIMRPSDIVPRTDSGKVIRRLAAEKYFLGPNGTYDLADDVEIWLLTAEELRARKPWDWGGAPMRG